jgi:hypothetical protein
LDRREGLEVHSTVIAACMARVSSATAARWEQFSRELRVAAPSRADYTQDGHDS